MFCSSWTINSTSLVVIELFKMLMPCWEKCGHLFFCGDWSIYLSCQIDFVELFVPWPFHVCIVCNNTLFHSTILYLFFSVLFYDFFSTLNQNFSFVSIFSKISFFHLFFFYFYFPFNWFFALIFFLLALGLFFTFPPSCLSLEA